MLYPAYLKRCATIAWHKSIDSAANWGSVLGAGIVGAFLQHEGIAKPFVEGWLGVVESGLLFFFVAWIVIFLIRFFFIAPYSLWKESQPSLPVSQQELDAVIKKLTECYSDGNTIQRKLKTATRDNFGELGLQHEFWASSTAQTMRQLRIAPDQIFQFQSPPDLGANDNGLGQRLIFLHGLIQGYMRVQGR